MSKHRRAARVDDNQQEIVDQLRSIPGVTVQLSMDDILVGHRGYNFWFEIKEPSNVSKKTGLINESAIKPSQKKLRETWKGHYAIVHSIEQIIEVIFEVPKG